MLLPNKLYSFNESALSKFPMILRELRKRPMPASELYQRVLNRLSGVSEYIDVLDCLYALKKIEYDEKEGVIRYVI